MKPRKPKSDRSRPRKPGLDWIEKVLDPQPQPHPRPGKPMLRVVWNAPEPPRRSPTLRVQQPDEPEPAA
jgi:hypothetical protein